MTYAAILKISKDMLTHDLIEKLKWDCIPEDIIVIDLETTGLQAHTDRILEIGAIKFNKSEYLKSGEITTFQCFISQDAPIPADATEVNGITDDMVKDGDPEKIALEKLIDFVADSRIYAYNAKFDIDFLKYAFKRNGIPPSSIFEIERDVYSYAKENIANISNYRLGTVAKNLGISGSGTHRAVNDCVLTLQVFIQLTQRIAAKANGEAIAEIQSMQRSIDAMKREAESRSDPGEAKGGNQVSMLWYVAGAMIFLLILIFVTKNSK